MCLVLANLRHSGDLDFLSEAYEFYRALMWDAVPGFGDGNTGCRLSRIDGLELGYPQSEADIGKPS